LISKYINKRNLNKKQKKSGRTGFGGQGDTLQLRDGLRRMYRKLKFLPRNGGGSFKTVLHEALEGYLEKVEQE
jgi:hypothetical protein